MNSEVIIDPIRTRKMEGNFASFRTDSCGMDSGNS